MPRQNTRLAAEGAEFLVLGHLLVEGLQAYKMYTNMPGYDVLVVNPEAKPNRVARVSVKSRWKASANGFIINNFDSDFVVVVKLNRGTAEPTPPQFFVIPTEALSTLSRAGWGKLNFNAIPNFQGYMNAWHQISDFIGASAAAEPHEEDATEP
jgi:hypothetical protein